MKKRESQELQHRHFVLDGAYELSASLAHTKRSVVYRAHCLPTAPVQECYQHPVALKLVLRDRSDEAIESVVQEVKMLQRFDSPHILRLVDYVARYDICYLVYELADKSLAQSIAAQKVPIAIRRAVKLSRHLLLGLAEIHRQGVIHGDIKPENLLLTEADVLKIADFGLATEIGAVPSKDSLGVGTLEYLAPEQLAHGVVSQSCDLYAAAVTIFEIFTGHRPIESNNFVDGVSACLNAEYASITDYRDDISPAVEGVLEKALAVRPEDRFSNAEEFLEELLLAVSANESSVSDQSREVERLRGFYSLAVHKPIAVTACVFGVICLLMLLETVPSARDVQASAEYVRASMQPQEPSLLPVTRSKKTVQPATTHEAREASMVAPVALYSPPEMLGKYLQSTIFAGVRQSSTISGGNGETFVQLATVPHGDGLSVFVSFGEDAQVVLRDVAVGENRQFSINGKQLTLQFMMDSGQKYVNALLSSAAGSEKILILPYRNV